MEGQFIAYYRVSTKRQGRSGLGLEAQRRLVADYLNGGGWELIAEYTEVESGRRNDRPELAAALAHCRRSGAILIIAKQDRMGRKASYVLGLLDDLGDRVVFADDPHGSKLARGVKAIVAEEEGDAISRRTKAALAVIRERIAADGSYEASSGRTITRLGNPSGAAPLRRYVAEHGNSAAIEGKREAADARAADYRDVLAELLAAGLGNSAIARTLNSRGEFTPRRGSWTATAVRRLRARLAM